jgi:CheY-like chemotaxis protein
MKMFRLLLVEDQNELREVTGEMLRGYGYEVVQAATGEEGIKLANLQQVDAALIDLGLPDMSGQEVAKALRHLPIAILTGNVEEVVVPEARVILRKPLSPSELLEGLRRLLGESDTPPNLKSG